MYISTTIHALSFPFFTPKNDRQDINRWNTITSELQPPLQKTNELHKMAKLFENWAT